MGHHVTTHLGGGLTLAPWRLGFPIGSAAAKGGGGALGFPLGADSHLLPLPINTPQAPWLIHPILSCSPLRPSSHVWSRVRELEETPCVGRRHAAGFPVRVLLLSLLHWTRTRTTSIHCTCVISQRRYSCGACLYQVVRLHDLEVGFDDLHPQRLCGNLIPALGLQRHEH
jgi:hypothetical protein